VRPITPGPAVWLAGLPTGRSSGSSKRRTAAGRHRGVVQHRPADLRPEAWRPGRQPEPGRPCSGPPMPPGDFTHMPRVGRRVGASFWYGRSSSGRGTACGGQRPDKQTSSDRPARDRQMGLTRDYVALHDYFWDLLRRARWPSVIDVSEQTGRRGRGAAPQRCRRRGAAKRLAPRRGMWTDWRCRRDRQASAAVAAVVGANTSRSALGCDAAFAMVPAPIRRLIASNVLARSCGEPLSRR
jgi:hypothetical protein